MITITKQMALDGLEKAVEKRGADFNYVNTYGYCVYSEIATGEPRCLVGQVLSDLGVDMEFFQFQQRNEQVITTIVGDLLDNEVCGIDSKALDILRAAQRAQDEGETWGTALDTARQVAERHDLKVTV